MRVKLFIVTALVALVLPVAAQGNIGPQQISYMSHVMGTQTPSLVWTSWIQVGPQGHKRLTISNVPAVYKRLRMVFIHPPHESAWRCIHRYEGAWNDPNAPYWGGLQMDLGFQKSYGGWLLARKGTADHWTPLEQMWVAERAHRSGRGFYPWPNTARYCGLI